MTGVFVLDAVRTPIGRYGGGYAGVRPDDLAAAVVRGLVDRRPEIDPADIDDVILGDANQAGEDNRNVGRMAVLLAGLPPSVPGATVNRLCGSGMEAVIQASRAVATGDASLVIGGGVESMTRAPWVVEKPAAGFPRDDQTLHSTTLGWRMVNRRMPGGWTIRLAEGAELLAASHRISREDQDGFALASHLKALAAWEAGRFGDEIVRLEEAPLPRDESLRPETSAQALAALPPLVRPSGTVTAGNASPLNDGAAALLLADQAAANRHNIRPLARLASRAVAATEPPLFGVAPVAAAEEALKRAGIGWSDLSVVELNEAFAAQALACMAGWPDLDPSMVNPNGGALALGHPLGCSGARILATLAWELRHRRGGWGLAAICIGVGQGLAVVLEA